MKKSILFNFWAHIVLLAALGIIMIVDVVVYGHNSMEEFSTIAKIAGFIFTVDLITFVVGTFIISLFNRDK